MSNARLQPALPHPQAAVSSTQPAPPLPAHIQPPIHPPSEHHLPHAASQLGGGTLGPHSLFPQNMVNMIGKKWRGGGGGYLMMTVPALPASGDLPVFLTQQVESLTLHNRYCEGQLARPNLPHAALVKLHEQKSLLEHQMRLMNEQILKYRVCVSVCTCMCGNLRVLLFSL